MKKYSGQVHAPGQIDDRIQTVFITCDELDELPEWTIRRHLGHYAVMRVPGALLKDPGSSEFRDLQKLLVRHAGIKHIVLCQHSLCTKFLHELGTKRRTSNDSNAEYRRSLWQQQALRNALPTVRRWLKNFNREDIEVHGWIYESETDWISALDSDNELFVPLTAHTHFSEANQMIN